MKATTALLEKYCKSGPRYTSYPPAPHFHTSFSEAEWQDELKITEESTRGLSLYVHIPFCDSLCWYCGCNMAATRDYSRASRYLDILFQEIDRVAEYVSPKRIVRQVHWGGGTPTFLRPEDMERLFRQLRSHFTWAHDAEIGCEVDPRDLTRRHLEMLKHLGFNRVSLGVQDLDERVQRAVNRIQPESIVCEVYGWMRELDFDSINLDLMIGLPHQTVRHFGQTLDVIIDLAPDRLAVFNYAHVPWLKRHQKLIPETDLPDTETRFALQALTFNRLTKAGYVYIGMDHYALPNDELVRAQQKRTLYRNFQGYTTHKECDILAFGATSISQTESVYVQNVKKLSDYRTRIQSGHFATERGFRLSRDDQLRREVITQVMCDLELNIAEREKVWGINFWSYFQSSRATLEEMEKDGLLILEGDWIHVEEIGRLFIRNIAMQFDAYLSNQIEMPRYSKTV